MMPGMELIAPAPDEHEGVCSKCSRVVLVSKATTAGRIVCWSCVEAAQRWLEAKQRQQNGKRAATSATPGKKWGKRKG